MILRLDARVLTFGVEKPRCHRPVRQHGGGCLEVHRVAAHIRTSRRRSGNQIVEMHIAPVRTVAARSYIGLPSSVFRLAWPSPSLAYVMIHRSDADREREKREQKLEHNRGGRRWTRYRRRPLTGIHDGTGQDHNGRYTCVTRILSSSRTRFIPDPSLPVSARAILRIIGYAIDI